MCVCVCVWGDGIVFSAVYRVVVCFGGKTSICDNQKLAMMLDVHDARSH